MKPRFTDNQTAALIGRLVILEEMVERLINDLRGTQEEVGQKDHRLRFLEERLTQLTRPREVLTEREAAALLCVSMRTMNHWRHEKPARIRFISFDGRGVRYRVDDVESYLKSRERGTSRPALKAA